MRKSDRAAARFSVGLVAIGLAAGVLYLTGWGAIAKNVAVLAWRGNGLVNLAKLTPFTPPTGGMAEERLLAYLAVCERIKPWGDQIDAWETAHAVHGRARSFKAGAAGLVQAYLREFNLALQQQQMGPAEFAWIDGRLREAAPPAPVAPESDRALHTKYRDRVARAALGPHALKIAVGFAD